MPDKSGLISQTHIPPQTGRGVKVSRDHRIRVTCLKGGQVGDLFAFVPGSRDDYLSPSYTLRSLGRLYPEVGKPLYSTHRRPLLLIEEDMVGVHDLLMPACDSYLYELMGATNHPSCRDNLNSTLKEFDVDVDGNPDPVNLFQNTPVVDLEGHWEIRESVAKPGDYIEFRALEDLLVIVAACSMDLSDLNGGTPTDLMLEVFASR
jgi:uncharacterized protein YcgI (DUF1989 family)